jgi:23S rRNA G2069 N7-methylase RlmK/C1962 C5-methylase RlmI
MSAQLEMLANRVRKNARHLGKWAKREHVTCWRIYDRDIPELPITVDTYEGALVINDYRHLDEHGERGGGDAWLDDAVGAVRDALGASEVFVKQRERLVARREGQQYERVADAGAWRTVHEGGHRFRVNLSDYIDTGLFLDHRITRAKAAAEPASTMLNLFAYTGSFSVYCAAAGMQTTSVDLSKTYLEWAAENLALNALRGEIIHADVREFLADAQRAGRRWDLAVVDPPTFSNSKRMDYTWDVQRDHLALLDDVAAVAKTIWFSTNRRRFKLEWSRPGADLRDETRATIPPDFRDPKIHHAYRIVM